MGVGGSLTNSSIVLQGKLGFSGGLVGDSFHYFGSNVILRNNLIKSTVT